MIVIEPQHRLTCPPVTRGRTSAAVVATLLLISAPLLGDTAGAEVDDDAAKRAAEEIQAARDQANQAAAEFFAAQSELELLGDEAERLAAENAQLQHEVEALRSTVEQVAVNRFVSSGSSGIPLLTGYRQPSEQLQTDVLVNVVTESSADAMDAYDEARAELEANQQEVAENQEAVEAKREQFEELQAAAEAEIVHLQEVERKRLEDERVREALLAQQREEQRQRELAEQQQREAAAAQAAAEAEAASRRAGLRRPVGGRRRRLPRRPSRRAPPPSRRRPPSPCRPHRHRRVSARGARRRRPRPPPPPPPPPRSGIICPVAGSSAYSDTWGAARSGGRTHQGVDLLARTGTPLVAVVSGSVQFKQNSLGGNAVWLAGSDGNRYYYAHLSRFEGSSRGVSQGEVIGYVGDTGNARGTPHLHFEVHPGGGAAVNPYPWVRDAGC